MPRGGARVGAGRPPKVKMESGTGPSDIAAETGQHSTLVGDESKVLPLAYMLALMNDPNVEDGRRDRLAVAAAPYCHAKVGDGGKKDQKRAAAKNAGAGKFAPAAPPRLVSSR